MKQTNFLKTCFLAVSMLMSTLSTFAYDFEVDGIYYRIFDNNNVAVTYKSYDSTFGYTNDYSGHISIPETITYNDTVYSVTCIDSYAFYSAGSRLTDVTIPNSVTAIGYYAFGFCTGLTSIKIPNSVTIVGLWAFAGCTGLTSIDIQNKFIGDGMFVGCTGLTSVAIGDSVISIRSDAFRDCSGLTSMNFGKSVEDIGAEAFSNCSSLKSIEIPNLVRVISYRAFYECTALESVTLGNAVVGIGDNAFYGCNNLTKVNISDLEAWCNISFSNYASNPCYFARHLFLNGKEIIDLIIPNSVTEIKDYAFMNCSGLANITIPNSVTSIGERAFSGRNELTNVSIPSSVTSIGYRAFYNLNKVTLCGNIDTIGSEAFKSVSTLYITSEVSSLPIIGISPNHIYCYASVPPTCLDGTFSNYNGTLHVPATSFAAYFIADYWCNFANMNGDAIEPTSINLSQDTLELDLGQQEALLANVLPNGAYPNSITWISTNPDIASVSKGIITALAVGECDIIANCLHRLAVCHVVVKDATITISLDKNEAEVLPNHIITLTPSSSSDVLPELAVTSSAPTVAAARVVNGKVQVVGIKEGMAIITVGSADDSARPATCLVTVYTEPGDVNCDGFINISDVTTTISCVLKKDSAGIKFDNADLNGDGVLNISDVTTLIHLVLSTN